MEGVGCSNIELFAMGLEKGIRGGGDRGIEQTGFAQTFRPAIAFERFFVQVEHIICFQEIKHANGLFREFTEQGVIFRENFSLCSQDPVLAVHLRICDLERCTHSIHGLLELEQFSGSQHL